MLKRKYSLKTRYNFKAVLKYGEIHHTEHLIIRYLKRREDVQNSEVELHPYFGVIVSSKFHKNAVVKNATKRLILKAIKSHQENFPNKYYFVFIPKKNLLDSSGKIYVNVEELSTEINTFLSEVAFT